MNIQTRYLHPPMQLVAEFNTRTIASPKASTLEGPGRPDSHTAQKAKDDLLREYTLH